MRIAQLITDIKQTIGKKCKKSNKNVSSFLSQDCIDVSLTKFMQFAPFILLIEAGLYNMLPPPLFSPKHRKQWWKLYHTLSLLCLCCKMYICIIFFFSLFSFFFLFFFSPFFFFLSSYFPKIQKNYNPIWRKHLPLFQAMGVIMVEKFFLKIPRQGFIKYLRGDTLKICFFQWSDH